MKNLNNHPPGVTDGKPAIPASFYDSKGRLYVDCSECERGGYGSDADKCSSGHDIRTPRRGGCFAGSIIPGVLKEIPVPQGTKK